MDCGAVLCFGLFTLLWSQPTESCIPSSIHAQVPVQIHPGYVVAQVPLGRCWGGGGGGRGFHLTSSDPHFTVREDGLISTTVVTAVTKTTTFWVWLIDNGKPQKILITLTPDPRELSTYLPGPKDPWDLAHRRAKRRWSPHPFHIIENDSQPFPKNVEQIASDSAVNHSVYYVIRGPGVTLPPEKLFSVDRESGMVRVHYAIDREQYSKFAFEAQVFDKRTGKETDIPVDIIVLVGDINDNAPTFSGSLDFNITEQSISGTKVGVVNATDRDLEDTLHTKIRFRLLTQYLLFSIHQDSGMITTTSGSLDREKQAVIPVVVEIRDMDGATTGLFRTATASIRLMDINDNPPTFRKSTYTATVEENRANVLVLRIPVDDRDEEKTKNWNALFVITKGNESGNFRVDTDPKTNEGLLYVIKPLDYERVRAVSLTVMAQNDAPLVGTTASWLSIPVELSVVDVDEGPEFVPPVKVIRVKENVALGTALATYTAVDPETKNSIGIKYYRHFDRGSWLSIDERTAAVKVANTIDLESPLVDNAMYNITVKAVDQSFKTGIGTIVLMIEDVNDNVPVVSNETLVLCEEEGKMGSVTVEAHDADLSPYGAPFRFLLPEEAQARWRIVDVRNTSAVLQQAVAMPRGVYQVPIHIKDLQDSGGLQVATVRVCRCLGGQCVAAQSSVSIGIWGVLCMLLALLLALLLCMCFVFSCTTKPEKLLIEDHSGGILLKSNTEAPGEEVKSQDLLMIHPGTGGATDTVDVSAKGGLKDQSHQYHLGQYSLTNQSLQQSNRRSVTMATARGQGSFYSSSGGYHVGGGAGAGYRDALLYKQQQLLGVNTWDTNALYLDQKLNYFGDELEDRYANDCLRIYGYEGEGSAAGSVGCCSDLDDLDNLDFLDSLGSKFKTLASVCMDRDKKL